MIHIGTCSWAEKSLIKSGEFYPKGVRTAEARLKYYSDRFDTVEVDSTYYAIPDPSTVTRWAERTPEGFVFHIKVYGALTGHGIDPLTVPKDILDLLPRGDLEKKYTRITDPSVLEALSLRLAQVLSPLREKGKLGLLVFQFPPWFLYSSSNMDFLLRCKEFMKGLPMAVEFRHGSWLTSANRRTLFRFLKEHALTCVTADEPQFGSLVTIPFLPTVTTGTAYFRLHGRNRETWLRKGVETSERYRYLYSDNELAEFIPSILKADNMAEKTYVMFNNCNGGFAMKNALRLKEMIAGGGKTGESQ